MSGPQRFCRISGKEVRKGGKEGECTCKAGAETTGFFRLKGVLTAAFCRFQRSASRTWTKQNCLPAAISANRIGDKRDVVKQNQPSAREGQGGVESWTWGGKMADNSGRAPALWQRGRGSRLRTGWDS